MRLLPLFVPIAALLCSPLSAQPLINPTQAWDPANGAMRMSISAVKPGVATQSTAEFYVAFQNTGTADTVLNLGTMLGKGKIIDPAAVRLQLTDPLGKQREFACAPIRGVVGGMDDFIAPLPAGATYVLKLNLNEYCCRAPLVKLSAGHYRIVARFEGKGAHHPNLDTEVIALLNFWKGALESNALDFDLAEQPN